MNCELTPRPIAKLSEILLRRGFDLSQVERAKLGLPVHCPLGTDVKPPETPSDESQET